MSNGQGSISFNSPSGAGGGGTPFPAIGARDGLTIESDYVVLGNLATDVTDPAALLDNRRISMDGFVLYFTFQDDQAWNWTLNSQALGGVGNTVPTGWISPAASYWSFWQPSNAGVDYAPYGVGERWYSGYSVNPGVNLPTTARPNVVGMFWGYNTDYEQGQLTAGEASFRYGTETFFIIGGDPHFEFHTPEITTSAGTIYRLDSTYVSRTSGIGFREIVIDDWEMYSQGYNPSGGQFYAQFEYVPGSDTTTLRLQSQNPGGVETIDFGNWTEGLYARVAGQSGELFVDATTFLELGAQNIALNSTVQTNIVQQTVFSNDEHDAPAVDSQVDISGNPGLGFRLPSMTTVARLAIAVVATGGLLVYDNTLNQVYLWNGTVWAAL